MRDTGDSENPSADVQYHLDVSADDVADSVLLPGNPDRVDRIVDCWESARDVASHREYRTATGTHAGAPISATSTGIGSPSAAIAVEELANVGVETLIRVGSCGVLREEIAVGDLVITSGAVRQEGTSAEYVREDYPAVADGEVVSALVAAAERLEYDYHVGVTMSADSFYAGQGRPGHDGFRAPGSESLVDDLRAVGVANVEMEASAILTLSSLYGLRAGAVCTAYANRVTGEFSDADDTAAAEVASEAVAILGEMDAQKERVGADRWHAGLSLQ